MGKPQTLKPNNEHFILLGKVKHFIWNLKILGKVKHFIWWACHDILLTRMNLMKRNISNQYLCPICNLEEETLIHSFWECSVAVDVWGEERSPLHKWGARTAMFQDFWDDIMIKSLLNPKSYVLLFVITFGSKNQLLSFHQSLLQVKDVSLKQVTKQRDAAKPWRKLEENQIKFNWDAALNESIQTTRLGGLIRNPDYVVLVSFYSRI